MTTEPLELTEDELRALDAQYTPFPAFADWPRGVPRTDLWEETVQAVETARETVSPQELEQAMQFVMRAAAIDTGAIEGLYAVDRGFTITVAAQAAAWQAEVEKRGENVRPLFDAQLRTYELVLDVATQGLPVNEAWIRRLHEELTAPQEEYLVHTPVGPQNQPLPRGEYKRHPNHVRVQDGTIHAYAPVDQVPAEMHRLVAELESAEFRETHPAVQAAYAHYALVAIHPFADGNGRVARALGSVYLYRGASVPLLIFADRKFEYFDVLHAGDRGDAEPFSRFVFDSAITAMNLVVENTLTARAPDPQEAMRHLQLLMTAQGGLTHQELDAIAQNLVQALTTALQDELSALARPPGIEAVVSQEPYEPEERSGFRKILAGKHTLTRLRMQSPAPAHGMTDSALTILVSRNRDESETFVIEWLNTQEVLRFSLRDVYPELTAAAQQRLTALARRVVGSVSASLAAMAELSLRESGYG